jgi:hypothetical protein
MYNSVRVHLSHIWCPSTAYEGAQTLYIDTIWMWDAFSGGLQPQPWHPNVIWAPRPPNFLKFTPTCTGISVRVHPDAHPLHIKVLNHFVYIQYVCGIQFEASCSLNHDIPTSFGFTHTPIFQNLAPNSTGIAVWGCTHMPIHSISRC